MACQEAPGLVIEKNRLINTIHGSFLGIIGDANHSFGFHLCAPPSGDYSTDGAVNQAIGNYSCAIDIGMNWPASRTWLHWLIQEIREDRIQGIAEVIGSYDGKDVRYWSDSDGWEDAGVKYTGEGHDTWTHVSIYRSTAQRDHGILAGWSATGNSSGGTMSDYTPVGAPAAVKLGSVVRGDSVLLADLWGHELQGKSPYDATKSYRGQQLDRIEAATTKASTGNVDVAALAALLKPIIAEAVRTELAKLTLKAAP